MKMSDSKRISAYHLPDPYGRFGQFGGRYVPETLMAALDALDKAYREAQQDANFQKRLAELLKDYAGRPTPL
ncbi:MAG: tryptophan synthase subunit beta, partial [Dehalococcoidia bacterium]|nr:tryptophan synthase subunit beta [Dehalococcoidia bacterium]